MNDNKLKSLMHLGIEKYILDIVDTYIKQLYGGLNLKQRKVQF